MKVGVTGGTGNISGYITARLVAAGHEVVLFNRSGSQPAGTRAVCVDRADREAFIAAVRKERLEVGIDMICFNADDARVALEAFAGVRQLIHCSTGATYGFPLPLPLTEEVPCRAVDDYGRLKHEADSVLLRAHAEAGFPVTILKPNGTYGTGWTHWFPGQLPGSWLRRAVDGRPIAVVGDGDQIHHFLHSDDSARGFVGCVGNERTIGQVFNICSTVPYTWREFHETILRLLGLDVPVVGIPRETLLRFSEKYPAIQERNNWHHMLNSTEKLRRCVPSFCQEKSLEQGLREILRDFDSARVEPNPAEIDALLDAITTRQQQVGR